MARLSEPKSKIEIGFSGRNTYTGDIRADEFLHNLRGKKAIKAYREMRDNSSIIGAILYTIEQVLRDVEIKVIPADDSDNAKREAEFVKQVLDDMEHSLDDHVAEALSFLSYGFAWFEVVYKTRNGYNRNPHKTSKYTDGRMGIRKMSIRAPWTIDKFIIDQDNGDVTGIKQEFALNRRPEEIPVYKSIYYRTTSLNNDPSGRSILRNAYEDYIYLKNMKSIEAIAVERELHGVPVGRMPAEYLSVEATDEQAALRRQFETALRDLKRNEQGYILLPSDLYTDAEGKPTRDRLMDIELITSNGTRSIDIDPIIKRYEHSIARSIAAEFMMLGSEGGGSYALSKSKMDVALRTMESYIGEIVDTLNKQLIEPLWMINGLAHETMPKLKAGDVAPHQVSEISSLLRNLNNADIPIANHVETIQDIMEAAELSFDSEKYETNRATAQQEQRRLQRTQQVEEEDGIDGENPQEGR
jgi:phage gp29-like protein